MTVSRGNASITIFLTFVFLLFFSMIGVMFESARVLSSDGYFRVAARSAAMTVFGDFNRELFEEYGLFAYGGYDGIGVEDLNAEFLELLSENLSAAPEGKEHLYSDLYRFSEMESEIADVKLLMEQEVFHEQIKGFLKRQAVEQISEQVRKGISGKENSSVREKLAITKDYENGKYDDIDTDGGKETGGGKDVKNRKEVAGDGGKATEDPETGGGEESEKGAQKSKDREEELKKDAAGGNPLSVFSELAGNGILSLVCEEKDLSKQEIPGRESEEEMGNAAQEKSFEKNLSEKETGAADFLSGLMETDDMEKEDSEKDGNTLTEKTELFLYASEQFSNYTKLLERTEKYGLEYLIAGKEKENMNLSYVVNRLLAVRMLLNMAYAVTDPVLQEKSLATATILAGFTGLPPVISAVQYTILMILSFEEACVDVTALLEGKEVALVKNAGNFRMKYEEICICTKELFEKKALSYPDAKKWNTSGVSYQNYLYTLFLLTREEKLRSRMGDLIQHDLRERYNQTFTIDTCICASTYQIEYRIPYLFDSLPFLSGVERKPGKKWQEVTYAYKSK